MDANRQGLTAWMTAALVAIAGCSGDGKSRVTLSAKATRASASTGTAAGGLAIAGGITLERVKLVVREVELEREGVGAVGDDDGTPDQGPGDAPGTGGEIEVSDGPFLVDLDAAALAGGTIVRQFTIEVAEGTYDELKFKIHHLEDGQSVGDPDFDSRDASVVASGTLPGGAAFTFKSRLNDHQKLHGTFVVGGEAASNITLTIDPSRWFVDGAGGLLDPTDEANRDAIEENVRTSIDAFDDDDHDGADDHGADDGPGHDAGDDHGGNGADDGPNHT